MPCSRLPQLVRTLAYPSTRCVACHRRFTRLDQASQGNFPLFTPQRLVVLRAGVCRACLDYAAMNESGVQQLALAIIEHLGQWYVTWHTRRRARAVVKGHRAPPPGVRRRR